MSPEFADILSRRSSLGVTSSSGDGSGRGASGGSGIGVRIVSEQVLEARGSCCDNGRMHAPDCGYTAWYHCQRGPSGGGGAPAATAVVQNTKAFPRWLKFSESGFPLPPTAAHLGTCNYRPFREFCGMPQTCHHRLPRVEAASATGGQQVSAGNATTTTNVDVVATAAKRVHSSATHDAASSEKIVAATAVVSVCKPLQWVTKIGG